MVANAVVLADFTDCRAGLRGLYVDRSSEDAATVPALVSGPGWGVGEENGARPVVVGLNKPVKLRWHLGLLSAPGLGDRMYVFVVRSIVKLD
jgi:hypothetical protein